MVLNIYTFAIPKNNIYIIHIILKLHDIWVFWMFQNEIECLCSILKLYIDTINNNNMVDYIADYLTYFWKVLIDFAVSGMSLST